MTAVMVLAAGLGTRLRPLTDELPKPLVPIGDRPALFHVLERVRGIGPTVVNAHHFADALRGALAAEPDVKVSHETELLGTAGGVAFAAPLLGPGDVLIWNADVLAAVDARALVQAHAASGDQATLVVRRGGGIGTGNVGIDALGKIVRLRGETFAVGEVRGADFLGIHVLGAELRDALPRAGCLISDLYLPCADAGARYGAFETEAGFVDVGTLRAYLDANLLWLRARGERAHVAGAVVSSVAVGEGVVVGEGARVVGAGALERVVVWPGAIAEAPLTDAIVTRRGVVRLA